MCDRADSDYYAFDILSDILSNGRSSRLNQHLVQEKQLFSSIDAYISGTLDAGLFHISGKPAAGVSLEEAEAAVREELNELQSALIQEQELEKVKNKFESTQIFGNINYLNVATNLAWFELNGRAEDMEKEVERYRAVTADRLNAVAQTAFREENGVVLFIIRVVEERRMRLIYKNHYKALFLLGLPIVIGQVGVIVLGFADTLMIGHHSTNELGAASFVNNMFTLAIIFSTGFSYGLTPIVGAFMGLVDLRLPGRALRCSLLANLLVGILLTVIMGILYLNVERLGQPEELLPLIKPYYLILLASLVFVLLFNGFKQFTDGITDTKTAMWILLGGNVLNIVGNYILINGKLGLPELGLLGAGISTLFSRIVMVLIFVFVFLAAAVSYVINWDLFAWDGRVHCSVS